MRHRSLVLAAGIVVVAAGSASAQPGPAPQAANGTMPGLGSVVAKIPGDLWRFVSLDTAVVLTLGGAAAGVAHHWDSDLSDELTISPALNNAFEPGATYGAFSMQVTIGIGMYAVGRVARGPNLAATGADIMRAQILSQAWVQALKYAVGRTRPDGSDDKSFPSGHSASGFATAAVIGRHYGWKAGAPAFTLAAYVAASRVHDNRHYLSDVIFGAAIGLASERTVILRSSRYTWRLIPTGTPHAAVIHVVIDPHTTRSRR